MYFEEPLIRDVSDKQLTASSSFNEDYGPDRSRLFTQKEGSLKGAWSARYNDGEQWLQVLI